MLPEHRSLFPALLLQRSLQQSVPGDLAALYGFPNPRAVPVFTRVGYRKTLDVRRFVRVLRSGEYLRRHFPGWVAALIARPLDLAMGAVAFMRWPRTGGFEGGMGHRSRSEGRRPMGGGAARKRSDTRP